MTASTHSILCLGEALIDVVHRDGDTTEHVGGSLLNVACGLARLGQNSHIAAWWGDDQRGRSLQQWATESGVSIVAGTEGAERTSVAFAEVDDQGRASYTFDLDWQVPDLGQLSGFEHLHTGSIAATLEPGGSQVIDAVQRMRQHGGTVSYDPNVRPAIMESPEAVRDRIEALVAASDVVKSSDEDVEWLYPGEPVEDVMRRWVAMGPAMVVITRGPWGAYALLGHNRDMLVIDQLTVEVGDTVGAGDSFMAGLISGLFEAGLLGGAKPSDSLGPGGAMCNPPCIVR